MNDEILNKTNGHCTYCGDDLTKGYHKDHIKPRALGGKWNVDNLVPSCPSCNSRKHAMNPSSFKKWIKNKFKREIRNFTWNIADYIQYMDDESKTTFIMALNLLGDITDNANIIFAHESILEGYTDE